MKKIDYRETFKTKIDTLNDKLVIRKMNGLKFMETKNKLLTNLIEKLHLLKMKKDLCNNDLERLNQEVMVLNLKVAMKKQLKDLKKESLNVKHFGIL